MFYTFQQKTELEQLRAFESLQNSTVSVSPDDGQNYEAWLVQRLQGFKTVTTQTDLLQKPATLFKRFVFGFVVVFGLIGLVSASGLIATDQKQVNVFWLLGSLLGANGITLTIWLIFVVTLRSHNTGIIASLLEWPLSQLYRLKLKPTPQQAVNAAWWQVQFSPSLQTWRLSELTHLAWLCFLCGSLLGLVLVFTTQQYDFIWESTLISQSSFQVFIRVLEAPLEFLSLPIAPFGETDFSAEALRQQWAMFIFSCVLLYAIFPRVMALTAAHFILRHKQRGWLLDFSHDYYIGLRGQFNAEQYRSQVIDVDLGPPLSNNCVLSFSPEKIPNDLVWYGLEVNPNRAWKDLFPRLEGLLNESQKVVELQSQVQRNASDFVIFVEGQRLPDRGLMRSLTGFNADHLWLAITTETELNQVQQGAWLKAILQCQLNEKQCVLVKIT